MIQYLDDNSNLNVFSSADFLELSNGENIRVTLNRMAKKGLIKKIIPGFYYRPEFLDALNEYEAFSPHQFALAMARKYNWNIAPSGLTSLNLLGLSQQVPAKWSYISDGSSKKVEIDNVIIEFKKKTNREIAGMSYKTAMVIQAIKELGKGNIDDVTISKIQKSLSAKEMKNLIDESKSSFAWIFEIAKQIAGDNVNE